MYSSKAYKEKRRKAEETLRLLKLSGTEPYCDPDYTIEDFLDELNIADTPEDLALEAEAVILFFNLGGQGFKERTCPECGKLFAVKYSITKEEYLNPPKIHDNMKPEQKAKVQAEIEELRKEEEEFSRRFGMKCSNSCRALALKRIGINWNPYKKPESRWAPNNSKGEIPLIVPPGAYEILVNEHNMRASSR